MLYGLAVKEVERTFLKTLKNASTDPNKVLLYVKCTAEKSFNNHCAVSSFSPDSQFARDWNIKSILRCSYDNRSYPYLCTSALHNIEIGKFSRANTHGDKGSILTT